MLPDVAIRATRFLGVTVVTAPIGQVLIFLFFAVLGIPGVAANAFALLLITGANLWLSAKFIWALEDAETMHRYVVVFVLMSLVSLLMSSIGVAIAVNTSSSSFAANIGSLAGYGVGFVLRFLVLDRYFAALTPAMN